MQQYSTTALASLAGLRTRVGLGDSAIDLNIHMYTYTKAKFNWWDCDDISKCLTGNKISCVYFSWPVSIIA